MKFLPFLIDTKILLDILYYRTNDLPRLHQLLDYIKTSDYFFLSIVQIPLIESAYFCEDESNCSSVDKFGKFHEFLSFFQIIKTPAEIDCESNLFKVSSEVYLIHQSARLIGAKILTNNSAFLKNSELTISVDDFFKHQIDYEESHTPFLDIKSQNLKKVKVKK